MLGNDLVEEVVVAGFLVVHVLHQRTQVGVFFHEQRGLRGVDQDGGEFAGLVYAEGGGEEGALGLGELVDGCGGFGRRRGDGGVVRWWVEV